jgi:V8-like Glu-specific endopeptidase
MKTSKTLTMTILCGIIALVTLSNTAYAITGNYQFDSTPYVGVIVLFNADENPIGYCSGVLISPNVILTAGHSTLGTTSASVCFDKGPITFTIQDGKIVPRNLGTIYNSKQILTYPEYSISVMNGANKGNNLYSSCDIGVIVLDNSVTEVTTYAHLPPAGFASTIDQKTDLKVIGYGVQTQLTPKNDGVENSWAGTISCNSAQTKLVSCNDQYLKLSANPSQGKGGVAFGDSGGPVIYHNNEDNQNMILAINAYVSNANCNGVTYHTRIDLPPVQSWINNILKNSLVH